MSDDSYVLDLNMKTLKSLKWEQIPLETNERPKGRENAAMFYDSNESRLVLFGGWANYWLGEVMALNVSLITGPPYAIYDIKPKLGPLTGKTRITITGDGFVDSGNITVKFSVPGAKGIPPEVQGNYVSPTELFCDTPNFESFGAKKAEVRLSINKGDFTIMHSCFSYYLNTKADKTIAYGPGLLGENLAGAGTVFLIQARNAKGFNRESGSDGFEVKITAPNGVVGIGHKKKKEKAVEEEKPEEEKKEGEEGEEKEKEKEKEKEEENEILYEIIDNDDGSYLVKYTIDCEVSNLKIDVNYKNELGKLEPIRGSPFYSGFKNGVPAKNNELIGPAVFNFITNNLVEIEEFMASTKENINIRNINKEEVFELLRVIENLQKIANRKEEIYLTLDILEQTVKMLEKNNISRDQDLRKILKLQEEWTSLHKMAATVEKDIALPVKNESDKAKENLSKFEEMLKEYFSNMKKETFYMYKTGIEAAFSRLDSVNTVIGGFEEQLKNFDYFSRMFNFPDAVAQSQKNLDQIKSEANAVKNLWSQIKKCDHLFIQYKKRRWVEVDTNEMEEEVKKLKKELMVTKKKYPLI